LQDTKIAYQLALLNSRFKAGFLGRIAHELRSPLSSLMALHQLIINDLCENPEEEKEFIKEAYKYSQKLLELIDTLVEVSNLEVGKIAFDIKKLSLSKILDDVKKLMDLQAANRNLKLKFLSQVEDINILADQKKLLQSLLFLIEIAIDYSEFGTIQLTVDHVPKSSTLVNINIDLPDHLANISEPINLSQSLIEDLKPLNHLPQLSSGMKLMLAQSLIEMMGGKLEFAESPHKTTRLQLFLPLADSIQLSETL
jgi:signal transduction histidine kinase